MPCFNNINRDAIKTAVINQLRVPTRRPFKQVIIDGINMIDGIPVYAYLEVVIDGVILLMVRKDTDPENRSFECLYGEDPIYRGLWSDCNGPRYYTYDEIIDVLENDIDWDEDIWSVMDLTYNHATGKFNDTHPLA